VGIAFGNWLSLLLVMFPITAVLIVRIRSEEAALFEEFGAEYAEYKRQTRKLVPGVY
jgi:protein-S-isoprenylcysteine O-methyltransferase